MADLSILAGATSQSILVDLYILATGAPQTALVFNSSGLTAYYSFAGANATSTSITLATLGAVNSAWSSGGFIKLDDTNMPGVYRFDVPNAVIAASKGREVIITFTGFSGMATRHIKIELTAVDNQSTGFGLSNVSSNVVQWNSSNVSSPATAGIPDINVKNINNVAAATPGASGGILISGSNSGTTTFGAMTCTGSFTISDGLLVSRSSSNASAITATGNGTGHGISATSGSGATGNGFIAQAASTNGNGLSAKGTGTGNGFFGQGGDGASGDGMHLSGGAGASSGLRLTGGSSSASDGLTATAGTGGVDIRGAITGNITGNVSGSVGSVTGAVGSVTGLTASNLDATISSRMATYTQPTGFLAATFPTGTVANTTNITAGTITTVTNLTNAPTAGDFTATMKTSLNAATPASVTGSVGSVTGAVGSVTGSVGSVTGAVGSVTGSVGSISGVTFPTNFSATSIDSSGNVSVKANLKKNTALSGFSFIMTDSTNHAPKTGLTVTTTVSLDGASAVATTNSVTEVANGEYKINFAAGDLNANSVMFRATATGADDCNLLLVTTP